MQSARGAGSTLVEWGRQQQQHHCVYVIAVCEKGISGKCFSYG